MNKVTNLRKRAIELERGEYKYYDRAIGLERGEYKYYDIEKKLEIKSD